MRARSRSRARKRGGARAAAAHRRMLSIASRLTPMRRPWAGAAGRRSRAPPLEDQEIVDGEDGLLFYVPERGAGGEGGAFGVNSQEQAHGWRARMQGLHSPQAFPAGSCESGSVASACGNHRQAGSWSHEGCARWAGRRERAPVEWRPGPTGLACPHRSSRGAAWSSIALQRGADIPPARRSVEKK